MKGREIVKKLICEKDVQSAIKQGQKVIYLDQNTIITPSAKDAAGANGIEICEAASPQQAECGADQIDSDMIYKALKVMVEKGMLKGVFDEPDTF